MSPIEKSPIKTDLKALKAPLPVLSAGRTIGLFAEGEWVPYCDRCKRRPSEVIVGESLETGRYLCRHCWGRE